ncbi:MAG: hypothetical protein SGJ09_14820 [Phycisphaerae bacterium]|nr:hypothetical protein [Phycisphaerae bacterium]
MLAVLGPSLVMLRWDTAVGEALSNYPQISQIAQIRSRASDATEQRERCNPASGSSAATS